MPTKTELLRLQKLYHSDKKIAEALGGIPEYLVTYWRRKKGIAKPSFAKYSDVQIRELWERFGDDFHCGRELGISKAAFYSWRRRYGFKEKPLALKLEQLELRFGWETKVGRNGSYIEYYQTAYEKILAKSAGVEKVQPDELIRLNPDMLVLPENSANSEIEPKYESKCRWVRTLESAAANRSLMNPGQMLENSFEVIWKGLLKPNLLIVTTYPELHALGAFSAATISLEEKLVGAALQNGVDFKVPSVVKVNISGRIPKGYSVIDLMGLFILQLTASTVKGKMVELSGPGIEKLPCEEKMSLCYFLRLAGAESAACLFDESARKFLAQYSKVNCKILFSDRAAHYESEYLLNTVGLESYVFPRADLSAPVKLKDAGGFKPELIFIGGPCGGSAGILKSLSEIVKGKRIHKWLNCYISPLTQNDFVEALRKKAVPALAEFGCQFLPAGLKLDGFLKMTDFKGMILTVPDKINPERDPGLIMFSSAETAIASAAAGKLV